MRYTFLDLLGLNPLRPMIAYGGDDSSSDDSSSDDSSSSSSNNNVGSSGYVSLDAIANEAVQDDPGTSFSYMGETYDNVHDYHDAIFGDDDDDDDPYVAPQPVVTTPTTTYTDTSSLAGIADASGDDYVYNPDTGTVNYDPIVSTGTGTSGEDATPVYDPIDTSYTDTSSISGVADASGVANFFPDDDDDDKMDADLGVGMSPVTVTAEDLTGDGEDIMTLDTSGGGSVTVPVISDYTDAIISGDMTSDSIVGGGFSDPDPAPAPAPEPEPVFYDMFGNEYSTPEAASAADSSYIVEIDDRPEVTLEAGFDVDTGGDLDPAGLYDPQPLADVNVPIPESYLPTSEDFMPGITGTDAPRPDNNDILNLYGIEPDPIVIDPVTTPVDTSSLEGILEASDLDLDLDLPDVTVQPVNETGVDKVAGALLESRQRRGPIDGFSLRDPEEDVGLIPDDAATFDEPDSSLQPASATVDLPTDFPSTDVLAAAIQRGDVPRDDLVDQFGVDAVREAESTLLNLPGTEGVPLGDTQLSERQLREMEDLGILGNTDYRDPLQDSAAIPVFTSTVDDLESEVPTLDDAPITYEGDQEAGSTTFEGTSDVTGLPDDAFDFVETPTLGVDTSTLEGVLEASKPPEDDLSDLPDVDVDLEDYAPTSTDLYTPTSDELQEQLEELGVSEGEPEVDDFPTGPFVTPELTGLEEFEADMYESGAEGTVDDFMEDMSPFEVSEIEDLADEYYETGAGSDGFTTDVYMPTDESFEAASEDMNALDELAETIASDPDPDPAPAPVFTDSEGNEFSTEAERDESQGQIDARNRRNEIDDLIGMGVDPALATAAVDIGVDPTAISGTDAQVDPDLDVDVDADVADADTMTASEAYLSAMKKLDDPNSMTEAEQRALYGARGQVPNAAEAAYLQDLLGNARHKEDGPIGPDGQPIYRAGDYVTDQSFGDTLEDLFVSGFDLLVNPLSILGDKFTLEGQRDQYVEDQLDAYKNGGTFVYGEDGNTVVGVAEANFDADGDGVNDTVVLNNANGDFVQDGDDIIVGSGGISITDVNINNDVDDDSEEYDIDVIYSDTTYTNTEDGVVEGTVDRTEEEIGDDPSDPCPEGFVLDPATGQCVPIEDATPEQKIRLGETTRPAPGGTVRPPVEPTPAEGITIRKPKQFAQGGIATPNIDKMLNTRKFAQGGAVTPNIDSFVRSLRG